MKVLSVKLKGREIATCAVTSPLLLIGRSPFCDLVVRAKGIRPVHYMVEWVGDGAFDPSAGSWSIFDISESNEAESQLAKTGSGEGIIVGHLPVRVPGKMSDLEFSWREDRLAEPQLKEGFIGESFNEPSRVVRAGYQACQLEVVGIRRDSKSIASVLHTDPIQGTNRSCYLIALPVRIEWNGPQGWPVQLDTNKLSDFELFQKGERVTGRNVSLSINDLVQIRWNAIDYYFRLVPKVAIAPPQRRIFREKYHWAQVGSVAIVLLILWLLSMIDFGKEPEPIPEPPRVARIEIKDVQVKPTPAPENPSMEPVPPVPNAKEEPTKEVKPADLGPAPTQSAPKPKFTNNESKAAGLNSPAPKANVNSIGLLGALKPKPTGTVSADKVINDGLISHTVSGDTGQVKLQQPPTGVLARETKPGKGLSSAYTTVGSGDSEAGKALMIADGDALGGGKVRIRGDGTAVDSSGEFTAQGGLDKESVKRAIAAYRKDIRTCYERSLLTNPKISGRVSYKWEISPAGPVNWINVQKSTLNSNTLVSCVQDVIKGINFPRASNGQKTIVIYPFEFQSKKAT